LLSADAAEEQEDRIKSAHQEMTEGGNLRPLYLDAQVELLLKHLRANFWLLGDNLTSK